MTTRDTNPLRPLILSGSPTRIWMGELRGKEAQAFLDNVTSGYPGECTTLHAASPTVVKQRLDALTSKD